MGIDELYKVIDIGFTNSMIEATKTDLLIDDVPEDELFDVMDFEEFRIHLINQKDGAKILDFEEYKNKKKGYSEK